VTAWSSRISFSSSFSFFFFFLFLWPLHKMYASHASCH
jgi:hypothetical protein